MSEQTDLLQTARELSREASRAETTWKEGAFACAGKIERLFPWIKTEVQGRRVIVHGCREFPRPWVLNAFDFRQLINVEGSTTDAAKEVSRVWSAYAAGGDPADAAAYAGNPVTYVSMPNENLLQMALDTKVNEVEFQQFDRSERAIPNTKLRYPTMELLHTKEAVHGVAFEQYAAKLALLITTAIANGEMDSV